MENSRVSPASAPPGVPLATTAAPPSSIRGRRLSQPSSSSSANATTSEHQNTSPSPREILGADFSLTSNRAGGDNSAFNSWDAPADNSNLTFSQVSPSAGLQQVLGGSAKAPASPDMDSDAVQDDTSLLWTKMQPHRRGEPAVKFAAFGHGSQTMESQHNESNKQHSASWHPQGLFGAALERFQSREAAPDLNAATSSMDGTMLGIEVPDDLSADKSLSTRRLISGPSVHAIQFDTDFGGIVTPFMSISSLGISRQSMSCPLLSVAQLSAGSMPVSTNSYERDPPVQNAAAIPTATGTEARHAPPPPSLSPSPSHNNETVPAVHAEPTRSTRSPHVVSPPRDADGARRLSSAMSPSAETAPGRAARSFRTTISAIDDDDNDETPQPSRDFLMGAEVASPAFQSTDATIAIPAVSTTGAFESRLHPHVELPLLAEEKARATIEYAEAAELKKLRSLQKPGVVLKGSKDRAVQLRNTQYAGGSPLRQLDAEEKEQQHSPRGSCVRSADERHELREKQHSPPTLPQFPMPFANGERTLVGMLSSKRRASDTASEARRKTYDLPSFTASSPGPAPPLPRLASPRLSAELQLSAPQLPLDSTKNADVSSESRRQRELKLRTPLQNNAWRQDVASQKFSDF
ncbi:hypothetical protein ABB37_05043 [Leptomonas pyrrhocoris]|uniref:Uncharacterized protein n=1 Tax=Leptomonas pyrrhocoris TaxID=157538 RepID=A0A0M9G129_LEPPY|nr:hypothetical protein ABB37_05043 [Leptomonas pyrrhocoris]KPA80016.1 hypothetical protein ABB37_05043 [Leptomonas pyrrhocoris]|eukprot:XP_015658455.1 hypothetical protein ABB37_05043 [Leptomonas pyrrhocoris]